MTLILSIFLGNLDILYKQRILFKNFMDLINSTISMPKIEFYNKLYLLIIKSNLEEDLKKLIISLNNFAAIVLLTF